MKKRVCFFVRTNDRTILDRVEFYRQDLAALRQLDLDLTIATSLRELLAPTDVYVVWWWNWAFLPVLVARLRGTPTLVTGVLDLNNPQIGFGYYTRPAWQKALMRWGAQYATANVWVSRMEHENCTREFGLSNSVYVPLGVDTTLYQPASDTADVEASRRRDPFLFAVAWLHADNAERKGIYWIIRALPQLLREHPRLRVVIAGERGTGHPKLLALAEELGVAHAVEFPGAISAARKIELMQRCAIYLQPSEFEGFGLAILEAMSCGAAVVTTPVGSVPEVVGNAGLLVQPKNAEAIAAAVSQLLRDPARRAELGRLARARALAEFPIARRQQGLIEVIDRLLGRQASPVGARPVVHPAAPDRSSTPAPPR